MPASDKIEYKDAMVGAMTLEYTGDNIDFMQLPSPHFAKLLKTIVGVSNHNAKVINELLRLHNEVKRRLELLQSLIEQTAGAVETLTQGQDAVVQAAKKITG